MATELYGNNASTTVAIGGYTSGSGVLNVASTALPFPQIVTGQQFHVLIYRIISGVVTPIVLLKVTAINSGTAWTVTAEGTDANALATDLVVNVLSAAGMNQIRSDQSQFGVYASLPAAGMQKGDRYRCSDSAYEFWFDGSLWVPFVPDARPRLHLPPTASWTFEQQNSSTIDWSLGFGHMEIPNSATASILYRTAPSTPYTIDVMIEGYGWPTSGNLGSSVGFFGFRDAGGKYVAFNLYYDGTNLGAIQVSKWSSGGTFNASYAQFFPNSNLPGTWPRFLRIADDGTNLVFSFSYDGIYYHQATSQLSGDWLSTGPTKCLWGGWAAHNSNDNTAINLLSWYEH